MPLTREQARDMIAESQVMRESGRSGKHRFHIGRDRDMQDVRKGRGEAAGVWYMDCVNCERSVIAYGDQVAGSAVNHQGCVKGVDY